MRNVKYFVLFFIVIALISVFSIYLNKNDDEYFLEDSNSIKIDNNSKIVNLIGNANSICFIGDSITKGNCNGGYGWYEPLMGLFNGKKVTDVSVGGATTKTILNMTNKIKNPSDLYVIAIGTNDVHKRDVETCSMDEIELIENINKIIVGVPKKQNTKFVLIAPWISLINVRTMADLDEEQKYLENYSIALEKYCTSKGYLFINPNGMIIDVFKKENPDKYLIDAIHPNSEEGIELYSKAVMENS